MFCFPLSPFGCALPVNFRGYSVFLSASGKGVGFRGAKLIQVYGYDLDFDFAPFSAPTRGSLMPASPIFFVLQNLF